MVCIDVQRPAVLRRMLTPREGPTLEDVLSGAWEDLCAHRTTTCPVCNGAVTPRYGSGPSAVGGRCGECRSELA